MAQIKKYFPLILVCLLVLLFYGFISTLYFSQDDFFHLRVSQTNGSFKDFINLFSFRSFSERGGIYFYRPIFREGLFNIFYRFFGLNPFPFRALQLLIHLINTILVYKLIKFLSKRDRPSIIGSLIFGVSAANVGVLSYLAGGIQASGMTTFLLLSVIYFLKDKKLPAFLFFVLALASHELAVSFPFIVVGLIALKEKLSKKFFTQVIKDVWPYLAVSGIFLYLQAAVIGLPTTEAQYGLSFSISRILNSYSWYFAWSWGIPEMLLDFVGPGLKLNPNLMEFWGSYFKIIFPVFGALILILLLGIKKQLKNKFFWFFVFWFIAGISPVVFLPLHRSTYYLAFSLVGIAGMFGLIFESLYKERKTVAYLLVGCFLALSVMTICLSKKTYWAISRDRIARELIQDTKSIYPSLPKGAVVYFLNDPDYPIINEDWGGSAKQAKVVLSGSDALVLLYEDESLRVLYEGDELKNIEKFVFPVVAKIRI